MSGYEQDAFGNTLAGAAADNPFDFGGNYGYWRDPDTGLIYVRARWYDPTSGQWLSADPVEGEPRYAYCYNQPTVFVDPSGMQGNQVSQGQFNAFVHDHLISMQNLPMRDLRELLMRPASQRPAYFRTPAKQRYSLVGIETLLSVAHWFWPHENSAPQEVMNMLYDPGFRDRVLRLGLHPLSPDNVRPIGPSAATMARHARERRVMQSRIEHHLDPDIRRSDAEGAAAIRRGWRAGASITFNELTFHGLDRAGVTESRQYELDPGVAESHMFAATGRDLLITAVSLGTVNPETTAALRVGHRAAVAAARGYNAYQTGRGIASTAHNVAHGRIGLGDVINVVMILPVARQAHAAVRNQGWAAIPLYLSGKGQYPVAAPGSPGQLPNTGHLDANVLASLRDAAGDAPAFARANVGNMELIQAIRAEAKALASKGTLMDRVRETIRRKVTVEANIYAYRIKVLHDPTPAEVNRVIAEMQKVRSGIGAGTKDLAGQRDLMTLATASRRGVILVSGDSFTFR